MILKILKNKILFFAKNKKVLRFYDVLVFSLESIFTAYTTANFPDVMTAGYKKTRWWGALFILFYFFGFLFLTNLLFGSIFDFVTKFIADDLHVFKVNRK